jgi:MFS family permease
MSALAQALGALTIGPISDRFGRMWSASFCDTITAAGTAMQYTSHSRGLLLAGKMVTGLGIEAAMATAYQLRPRIMH